MSNKVIAYLDVLGFKNYLSTDIDSALDILFEIHSMIKSPYDLKTIDSFENFIPFSDSIFISSTEPNKFVEQISSFLVDCFFINASYYRSPVDSTNPTKITRAYTDIRGNLKTVKNEHAFPIIFKGGISYGECFEAALYTIDNYKLGNNINLIGNGVVNAYALHESDIKCPGLYCDLSFINQLDNIKTQYVNKIDKDIYEILWPLNLYRSSSIDDSIIKFNSMFQPVVNLWKAYNHFKWGMQYYNLLKLLIRSTVKYSTINN